MPAARRRGRPTGAARAVAVLALAAAALAGCTSGSSGAQVPDRPPASAGAPPALTSFYTQRVAWRACAPAVAGARCGAVDVPLDYARPAGRRIRIAIVDHPASHDRIGVLAVNPGGPGGSGVDFVPALLRRLPAAVRERFDIVGFDPRGVARSAPVTCVSDRRLDVLLGQVPDPRTPAEVASAVAGERELAAGCAARSGWELPFVGTAYAARDLDIVRAALGARQLSYLGKSYGTLLGATYADLVPRRVRAFVLDGAIDPALPSATVDREQAAGFETDLRDFVADCVRRGGCPLGSTVAAAAQRIDDLLAAVRARPLPAPRATHGPLTLGYATTGIVAALYSPDYWRFLRLALASALDGDGSGLMAIADAYDGRSRDGHYSNLMSAFVAITCADGPQTESVAVARRLAAGWAHQSPHFGPAEAWSLTQCASWPAAPTSRPHRLRAVGAPPILVVGTTRDPATPYAWARGLAAELTSGRLLGYDGDGHTAYAEGRSACIDRAVTGYLVDRVLPKAGTVCS
jgi:pimeloyl-ACP methyl ester carboxylesterase